METQPHQRPGFNWGKLLAWTALLLLIFITLLPLWITVKTAFSGQRSLFGSAASLLPTDPTLFNFRRALGMVGLDEMVASGGSGQTLNFPLYLRNSLYLYQLDRSFSDFLFGHVRLRFCAA